MTVEPRSLSFSFSTRPGGNGGSGIWFLLILALALGLFAVYFGVLRKKRVVISREDTGDEADGLIRGWRRLYLGEGKAGICVPLGLPNNYVRLGWIETHPYLVLPGGTRRRVRYDDHMICEDNDGTAVSLLFREAKEVDGEKSKGAEE